MRARMGWGWGLVALLALPAAAAGSAPIALPSGQEVTLMEMRVEPDENVLRLRYLAPAIGSPLTRPAFETLTEDLEFLCVSEGLTAMEDSGLALPQIVVSLSAEPVEFGVISPDVAQVFEAFRPENGTCMLEMF